MTGLAPPIHGSLPAPAIKRPRLDHPRSPLAIIGFFAALGSGLLFIAWNLYIDVDETGTSPVTLLPFLLLLVALLIALGFEFVNGFHDTANAVATAIYTHAMPAHLAVVWSGLFNFAGVMASSGAVAFGIVSLLPVELILQVGSSAGFAMVFALLCAAIIWNLGTWYLGLPASSSHTLIGSIIGVGVANSMLHGQTGTSGVDWSKAAEIGYALLLSPLVGFVCAALLFLTLKRLVRNPALYREPTTSSPPLWIRCILIATCSGVSFAHGSNDGQKGMGLIMLILVGTVPTAYALNRALPDSALDAFRQASSAALEVAASKASEAVPQPAAARATLSRYVAERQLAPDTYAALRVLIHDIAGQINAYGSLRKVPAEIVGNTRNDIYLTSETIRFLLRDGANGLGWEEAEILHGYKSAIDQATKFIPFWVKVAVAIALGLGTMVGWKRVVITVGEKIGKSHMTFGQGASAELVATATIAAADIYGLPVSTTHVLSSGVAGTMAANASGLQMSTIRNLLIAWVLTLPVAIALSGGLFCLFSAVL